MKKITKHGIKRLKQRNKNQCRNGIANIAKKCGKTKRYFDGEFYEYLLIKTIFTFMLGLLKNLLQHILSQKSLYRQNNIYLKKKKDM